MHGLRTVLMLVGLLSATGCDERIVASLIGPSLVAVHATWCQPCQRDKPLLLEVAREFPVTELDIDSQPQVAAHYGVSSLPTYIIMCDGQEHGRSNNLRSALIMLRSFNQLPQ